MKIRLNVFGVLVKKDMKNCFANKNVAVMLLLPIIFALLYKFVLGNGMVSGMFVFNLCNVLTLSVIPLSILSMLIAEEKEKHTLRSLMMAGVSSAEFISSKLLVCLILMLVEGIAIYFITGMEPILIPVYLLALILASLAILFFGAVIGISAKDQMAAGTIGTPLMMLLMLPPMFAAANDFFAKVSVLFPTTSLTTVFVSAARGEGLFAKDSLIALAVCLVWIVAGIIVFQAIYKKKGLDD